MGVVRMVDGSKRVEAGCMLDGLASPRNQVHAIKVSLSRPLRPLRPLWCPDRAVCRQIARESWLAPMEWGVAPKGGVLAPVFLWQILLG
jgi:hypothetical protein